MAQIIGIIILNIILEILLIIAILAVSYALGKLISKLFVKHLINNKDIIYNKRVCKCKFNKDIILNIIANYWSKTDDEKYLVKSRINSTIENLNKTLLSGTVLSLLIVIMNQSYLVDAMIIIPIFVGIYIVLGLMMKTQIYLKTYIKTIQDFENNQIPFAEIDMIKKRTEEWKPEQIGKCNHNYVAQIYQNSVKNEFKFNVRHIEKRNNSLIIEINESVNYSEIRTIFKNLFIHLKDSYGNDVHIDDVNLSTICENSISRIIVNSSEIDKVKWLEIKLSKKENQGSIIFHVE